MKKFSAKDLEQIREFLQYDCEYSGTKDTVFDISEESIREIAQAPYSSIDEIELTDGYESACLSDFLEVFWNKAVEKILDVFEIQDDESYNWVGLLSKEEQADLSKMLSNFSVDYENGYMSEELEDEYRCLYGLIKDGENLL